MTSTRPKISVVIPCFNYRDYVAEAIGSVLSQTYSEKEIIVVDDGSTDGSWEEIQKFGDGVTALRIENSGAARACLAGYALSTGDFVHFLDADDYLAPGALTQIAAVCESDVAKVQFQLAPVDGEGRSIGDVYPPLDPESSSADHIRSIKLSGTYTTPPTSGNVYRRDVIGSIGEPDYETWIDGVSYLLAPFVGRVVSIPRPLVFYRVHGRNFSAFEKLSAVRFAAERQRFMARLDHLQELCRDLDLTGCEIGDPQAYAYVHERGLLHAIASDRRPSLSETTRFVQRIWHEGTSPRRATVLTAWASLLWLAPWPIARRAALLKADPWTRSFGFTLVKRFITSGGETRMPHRRASLTASAGGVR